MDGETELVQVRVPKGMKILGRDIINFSLMIVPSGRRRVGEMLIAQLFEGVSGFSLVACSDKPDWAPPKLRKGWVTWDRNGGWWWWPAEPEYTDQYAWVDPSTGDGGDGEEIGEVMAEFLSLPDCSDYDERHCIWEVG